MSQQNDTGFLSLPAATALEPYRLVEIDSNGQVGYTGVTSTGCIGVTMSRAAAQGDAVVVKRLNGPGTFKVTAAAAITNGAKLYFAANGKVDDLITAGGLGVARAMEAATGDASEFEAYSNGVDEMKGASYTADGTDNTNNYIDITTGFGAAPSEFYWTLRTSAGADRDQVAQTTAIHTSGGVVRISNANIASGDIVNWRARP